MACGRWSRASGRREGKAAKESDPLVGLDDEQKFIHFVFEEFLKAKGNGFDGHVVTIGHALIELHRMGHKELARKGVPAYWQWVRGARAQRGRGRTSRRPRLGRQPRSPESTGRSRRSTTSARSPAATRSSTPTASTPWPRT